MSDEALGSWPTGPSDVADAVLVLHDDGTATGLTPPAAHLSGGQPLPGATADLLNLVHLEDREAVVEGYRSWRAGRHQVVHCRLRTPTGWRWCEVSGAEFPEGLASGGVVVAVRDVTDLRRAEQLLDYYIDHDAVTGLPLARQFRAALDDRAANSDQAVVLLDLDGLGMVNEQLGYLAGDRALAEVAVRVVAAAPVGAIVARLGGDELAVAFALERAGSASRSVHAEQVAALGVHTEQVAVAEAHAEQVARDLVVAVSERLVEPGSPLRLSAVAGVAVGDRHISGEQLLTRADVALHQAKRSGSLPVVRFDEALDCQASQRRLLRGGLRAALAGEEFVVEYQPVMTVPDERLVGFEALVRWDHPQLGRLGPDQFIALAEETGDILTIGAWVLRRACAQLAAWSAQMPDIPVGMAVNLSARQLEDPAFVTSVAEIVEAAGLVPGAICLEVTESVLLQDIEEATAALRALRATGVRVAIDDFGVGFSSLAYLRHFPADHIKIDRSFVAGLGCEPTDTVLVESIVTLAERLGIIAIAEGVETPDQQGALASMGCPLAQGYLWSPSLPAGAAGDLLARADPAAGGWSTPWSPPGGAAHTRRRTSPGEQDPPRRTTSARARASAGGRARKTAKTTGSLASPRPAVAAMANDEVASVMSYLAHEMRTPLHVIASFAEVAQLAVASSRPLPEPTASLEREPVASAEREPIASIEPTANPEREPTARSEPTASPDPGLVAALDGIVRQVARLERMVATLGDAKAVDQGTLSLDRALVDVGDLVARVAGDLAGELGDHPLVVGVSGAAPVMADAHRITQVLVNLVSNAAKFAPDATPIEIVVTHDDRWAHVKVIDRGPGIPDDLVPDAFRRFASLDRRRRGTGLGLYLARGVARAHGGELRYRRALTGGAEMELTLPLASPPALRRSASAAPGSAAQAGTSALPRSVPERSVPDASSVPGSVPLPDASKLAGSASVHDAPAPSGSAPVPEHEKASSRQAGSLGGSGVVDVVVRRDADALRAVVAAQHGLLRAATVEDVVVTVADLVSELGGAVLGGRAAARAVAEGRAIPLDLSFGTGPPTMAAADPVGVARMRLEAVLPSVVADATGIADRLRPR